jgi:MscS family membrane protein
MPLAHVIMLGLDMLAPVVLTFTLWRGVDLAMVFAAERAEKTETTLDDQLVPLLRKILKVLTLGFGLVLVLRALNFNIAALIAGASLGGLALALAAQDTIKNMFGSLMIFLDKPFHIGHWILADGVDGVVEEVGFRSTRVRTFQNSVVYVPNGKISDMVVNNMGMRQYRRYLSTLGIEYGTPADRIEAFVKALRELADQYPAAVQGQSQVHLFSFSASSLDIRFQVFLDVPNFDAELACREELMFSILRLAEQCQVGFAFPTQTLHVASLPTNGNANVR